MFPRPTFINQYRAARTHMIVGVRYSVLVYALILLLVGCGGSQSYPAVTVNNASSVNRVTIFSGHSGGVNAVAWSPDGKMLTTFSGLIGKVTDLGFSPDGKVLASSSSDHRVAIWDSATGARLGPGRTPTDQIAVGQGSEVNAVAWRPDATMLATASYDQRVFLWAVQQQ